MPEPVTFYNQPANQYLEPDWPAYRSVYGPKYTIQNNWRGVTAPGLTKFGMKMGAFGGVGLFTLLFFASGIPKIKKDILQPIPWLGKFYVDEIHPADNPF